MSAPNGHGERDLSMSALGQKQTWPSGPHDVRLTSKANIEATQNDVCFVPIADICPSFDELVGTREQLRGHGETESLCSF
jgi:hypothetical protein